MSELAIIHHTQPGVHRYELRLREKHIYSGALSRDTIAMIKLLAGHCDLTVVEETPIDVNSDGSSSWWLRGHVDQHLAETAISSYMDELISIARIEHDWWRYIPSSDPDSTGYYIDAVAESRGAFKVTLAYTADPQGEA